MSKHTWVVDKSYEFWEENAPGGTLSVNLRCTACNSVAQFTASGIHACTQGNERLFHQWTSLPYSDEEGVGVVVRVFYGHKEA